jgi:hypothetical protein
MLTFQKESLHPFVEEAVQLFEKHYEEIAERRDVIQLDPNIQLYDDLEAKDMLEVHTIRDDGNLVGYSLWFIVMHPHYKTSKTVTSDLLYIAPQYRKGLTGVKFIKWTTELIKERNPQRIMFRVKPFLDYGPILERLGASFFEKTYSIVLE